MARRNNKLRRRLHRTSICSKHSRHWPRWLTDYAKTNRNSPRKENYEPNPRSAKESRTGTSRDTGGSARNFAGWGDAWHGSASRNDRGNVRGSCGATVVNIVYLRRAACSLYSGELAAARRYHALLPSAGAFSRHGRVPHLAVAPVSNAREDAAEETADQQFASQRRQVFRRSQPSASDGEAARAGGAFDRR